MWKKSGVDGGCRRKNIQAGQTIGEAMEDFQTGRTIRGGGWCKENFQTGRTKQMERNRKKNGLPEFIVICQQYWEKLRSRQGNTSTM